MRLTFAGKGALLIVGAGLAIVQAEPRHIANGPTAMAELSAPAMAADPTPQPRRHRNWPCWPLM
jgi:hypothetical protein